MFTDNAWVISMVVMFGLFLVGVWIEARRSLRALAEDDFGASEVNACEEDYRDIMVRLEARTRLEQIRLNTGRPLRHDNYSRNGYNLG